LVTVRNFVSSWTSFVFAPVSLKRYANATLRKLSEQVFQTFRTAPVNLRDKVLLKDSRKDLWRRIVIRCSLLCTICSLPGFLPAKSTAGPAGQTKPIPITVVKKSLGKCLPPCLVCGTPHYDGSRRLGVRSAGSFATLIPTAHSPTFGRHEALRVSL
jgi:hypothetical protein